MRRVLFVTLLGIAACAGYQWLGNNRDFVSAHGMHVQTAGHYVEPANVESATVIVMDKLLDHPEFAARLDDLERALEVNTITIRFKDSAWHCEGDDYLTEMCIGSEYYGRTSRQAILLVAWRDCLADSALVHELIHFFVDALDIAADDHHAIKGLFSAPDSVEERSNRTLRGVLNCNWWR